MNMGHDLPISMSSGQVSICLQANERGQVDKDVCGSEMANVCLWLSETVL